MPKPMMSINIKSQKEKAVVGVPGKSKFLNCVKRVQQLRLIWR